MTMENANLFSHIKQLLVVQGQDLWSESGPTVERLRNVSIGLIH